MTRLQQHRRSGISLIEVCVALGLVTIALNFGAVLILTAMRLDKMSAETTHRLTRHSQLADLFRDDVRSSTDTPQTWRHFRAGPTCLILRQSNDRHIVYQFDEGKLAQLTQSGESVNRRPIALGQDEVLVEFERTDRVIRLRIAERNKGLIGLRREIRAALGGDLP